MGTGPKAKIADPLLSRKHPVTESHAPCGYSPSMEVPLRYRRVKWLTPRMLLSPLESTQESQFNDLGRV